MRHILAEAQHELLAQYAWSNVLLAFDYDGTLAPIVADRDAAVMRPRTSFLLKALCELYPCAVISGRGCEDVASRVRGVSPDRIIGNHGLEPGKDLAQFAEQMKEIAPVFTAAVAAVQGLDIEDKGFSLAVHYRRARRKREARQTIMRAAAALPIPMRLVPGKLVFNILPQNAPHKGDALIKLRNELGADTAIYVGDDITDEDVFQLDEPGRLLGVRVGQSRSSAAPYFLRDQREVDSFLARLLKARGKQATVTHGTP